MIPRQPVLIRQAAAPDPHPPRCTGAIVIGSDYRGLGVVRSLGRRGIPVWVLADGHVLAAASRYVRRRLRWPVDSDEGTQLEHLLSIGRTHRIQDWTLFPTGDETAAFLARHHDVVSQRFRLTTPPWDIFRWVYDKRLSYQLATERGVSTPWTAYPTCREEVAHLDCTWPVILKPAIKVASNSLTVAKAWRVDTRRDLIARYDQACRLVDSAVIMVQELIPGGGESQFSFAALCQDGRVLAHVVARRRRQYPVDFGRASTFVETVDDPAIEESASRLLEATRYTGLIEVEFKRDPRSGCDRLLDINPRVWGWHTLGQRAGVDFPYLQWRLAHSEPIPATRARPGVRWVRMTTDLPSVWHEFRRGHISPGAVARALRDPLEFAIFAPDDPLPALLEAPSLMFRASQRFIVRAAGHGASC